ncbi:NAD(P)H-hydrate dehydratase [Asticcacaulis sp. BYS171W]|uniref:ADP-dependent (S)-NAD(P)H-hydrate dehydratase n=1 Tax=Asticcacaulis aquaticus TaxID=2984212 RepID=A0ABT5HXV5_9CAUL|nr:NAD(P)H-hydrate dehydratase [Asticcacaulis aquaticus]MDC7684899.1 NAD(P)H-hydrate dehydratase [Asticcacaulis aquaticus]
MSTLPTATDNRPEHWFEHFPSPEAHGNKYDRGYAVVLGGPIHSTGASRLAARAALRVGAGLVSVACDPSALIVYATALEAVMTKPVRDVAEFAGLIGDRRVTAVLLGPAAGISERTRASVLATLIAHKPCVLDADALTVFKDDPHTLFAAIEGPCVLTPHDGEFERVFGKVNTRETELRARAAGDAAAASGAVVLLKGPETLIAHPDGRLVINRHAPPWLATAGSGDVLGGLITGLMAQGMKPFEAACAGVWLHSEAARRFGPGLIAEDLSEQIPGVLSDMTK